MVGGAISLGGDTEWGCARVLLRKSGKVQETGRFGEKGGEGGVVILDMSKKSLERVCVVITGPTDLYSI
jgi:hypothetical protein